MEKLKTALSLLVLLRFAPATEAQDTSAVRFTDDSIVVRFIDTDIRAVIQAIGQYLPKPVLVGPIQAVRVSLETPGPVSRARLLALLRGVVESQNLEFLEDSAFYRVGARTAQEARPTRQANATDSGPVQLFVVRLRHARASSLRRRAARSGFTATIRRRITGPAVARTIAALRSLATPCTWAHSMRASSPSIPNPGARGGVPRWLI